MAQNKNTKPKASTQDHLDIEDIAQDIILLKTGWAAMVVTITAVNFDILSEAEQDATIFAYGALLNSLSFPIQILIRSKKADITSYFHSLSEAAASQQNPDLKRQIEKYQKFIESIVQQKTVLDKKFYIIISFSPLELGIKGIKSKPQNQPKNKTQRITDAKINLAPKRDHLIKQSARLGLTAIQLNTQELIELMYEIYNPAPTGTQRVILDSASYTIPIVQPAVEVPTSPYVQPEPAQQMPQPLQAQPQPIPPPPAPNPKNQQEALKNLQEAITKASKIMGQNQLQQNVNTQTINQNTQTETGGQPNKT